MVKLLTIFTFATSHRTSRKFQCYRFLIFLVFFSSSIFVAFFQFVRGKDDEDFKPLKGFHVVRIVVSLQCLVLFSVNLAFNFHQICIKKLSLKVMKNIHKLDIALMRFCGIKTNYSRRLTVNAIITSLFIFMCFSLTFMNLFRTSFNFESIVNNVLPFLVLEFFLIFIFVINLCFELYSRLKKLNKFISINQSSQLQRRRILAMIDPTNMMLILKLTSICMRNISEFFEVELLIILGT